MQYLVLSLTSVFTQVSSAICFKVCVKLLSMSVLYSFTLCQAFPLFSPFTFERLLDFVESFKKPFVLPSDLLCGYCLVSFIHGTTQLRYFILFHPITLKQPSLIV